MSCLLITNARKCVLIEKKQFNTFTANFKKEKCTRDITNDHCTIMILGV